MTEDSDSPCLNLKSVPDSAVAFQNDLEFQHKTIPDEPGYGKQWLVFAALSVIISFFLSFLYLGLVSFISEKYHLKPLVRIMLAGLSLHLFLISGVFLSYFCLARKIRWQQAFYFKNWRYIYLVEALVFELVLFFPLALVAIATLFFLNGLKDFLGPELGKYIDTFPHFKQYLLDMDWQGFSLVVIIAVVLAPTIEEIVFRRVIFSALRFRLGMIASFLLTSAFFAFIHFRLVDFPVLFILGCIWQGQYLYHRSLFPSILYHTFHNALAMGLLFLIKFYDIPITM